MCSGIYGNSKEDRYFEDMLFRYLDEQEEIEEYMEEWEDYVDNEEEETDG